MIAKMRDVIDDDVRARGHGERVGGAIDDVSITKSVG